jgi:methylated-DNA-[protein]-cysteine S-methyltransferase
MERMIGLYTEKIEGVWFGVACDEKSIFATTFASSGERALRDLLRDIPFNVPFQIFKKPSAFAEGALALLKNVYDGKDVSESFPLATNHLSNYMRHVIRVTCLIPVGYVAYYGSVAKAAGGTARAVGHVMATHPFAPLVPCHRVVSADLTLGGYGGGLDVKLAFLVREKRGYTVEREVQVDGKKLQVFPVEFVLNRLEKERHRGKAVNL